MKEYTSNHLLLLTLLCAICALLPDNCIAQGNELKPGKWMGVQYVRSTNKKDKDYRGTSLPEISDSTYMELTIEEVTGEYFTGTLYRSFFQQPKENFCSAKVEGIINRNKVTVKVAQMGENMLKKYPGFYWCTGTLNLSWKYNENGKDAELLGKSSDAECFSGPITLKRKPEKLPLPPAGPKPLYTTRIDSLFTTVRLQNRQFTVELFDNGVIDGDSVTVYFNGVKVKEHQLLTAKPVSITLTAVENIENVLVMYADNLGTVPPNTAVMKVKADGKVYEVYLKADLQANAVVKFLVAGR